MVAESLDTNAKTPPANAPPAESLRSVHTSTFPALLDQLGTSLLVTTYQAGKLVALRSDDGVLNTHFRNFGKPMGLAVQGGAWRSARSTRCGSITRTPRWPQNGTARPLRPLLYAPRRPHDR